MDSVVNIAKARLARASQRGTDPAVTLAARREYNKALLRFYVKSVLEKPGGLTDEQRREISALIVESSK